MKKYLCLLLFATTVLISCKKKYCWECSTVASGGGTGTTKATYCDQTEDDISSKIGTTTSVDTVAGKPISVTYTTTCVKQQD